MGRIAGVPNKVTAEIKNHLQNMFCKRQKTYLKGLKTFFKAQIGRTDLILSQSKAKKCKEYDFDVGFHVDALKPGKHAEKRMFEAKNARNGVGAKKKLTRQTSGPNCFNEVGVGAKNFSAAGAGTKFSIVFFDAKNVCFVVK